MNIFYALADVGHIFTQGRAIKGSTIMVNAEAGAAMLYGVMSAVVTLLNDLGVPVTIGATELHTMADGWAITASLIYGVYRLATNPAAGVKA